MKVSKQMKLWAAAALCGAGLLSAITVQAGAFSPTPEEMAALPPFCKAKLRPDLVNDAPYKAQIGPDWLHIHHYCFALNLTNYYYRDYADKNKRRDDLKQALENYDYVFSHAAPDFWMRPEIRTQKAQLLAAAKNNAQAIGEIELALKQDASYAAAYATLSDIYFHMGEKAKSVATLEQGLQKAPDSLPLQRRYKQLTGKTFVPPAAAVSTPKATAAKPAAVSDDKATPAKTAVPAAAAADQPEKIGVPGNPYCRFCP